jgi:hypothetical protein
MSDQTVGLFLYLRTDWRGLNEKEWERRHRSPPSSAPHTGIIESSKRFFGSRDELAGIFKVCKPLTHAVVGESIRVFVSTENDRYAPIAVLSRKPKKMENSGSPVIFSSPIVN